MMKQFLSAVEYYSRLLRGRRFYLIGDVSNQDAFLSLAPLSAAASRKSMDGYVLFKKEGVDAFKNLFKIWSLYRRFGSLSTIPSEGDKQASALAEFIKSVGDPDFEALFNHPDVFIFATTRGFYLMDADDVFDEDFISALYGSRMIEELLLRGKPWKLRSSWFRQKHYPQLSRTCRNIWKHVYALKAQENVGMGFELIPDIDKLSIPLSDYLDSYAIISAMKMTCPSSRISLSAYSSRKSQMDAPEASVDLAATLLGCELEKNIDEPAFKAYKRLASALKMFRIQINDATFSIHGKGYSGRHLFGERIGYPTPDKKSRWPTPGGMIYKFPWLPQTKHESRPPSCRIAFTETLPVPVFIQSCDIDWQDMRKKNDVIIKRMNASDHLIVESMKTKLKVHLKSRNGKRRMPRPSDSDVRKKVNKQYYERTGIKAGNMANIPGGEAFVTPEYLEGTFFGDVVISIDQSYMLKEEDPLVVDCDKKGYVISGGPKDIVNTIKDKKHDALRLLEKRAKSGALPKALVQSSKRNFNKIGEFAINTNPSAQLCDYLIVNEKIAGMIHIALGSGFDDDRNTEYHYDIVIDAKAQQLDIYGIKDDVKGDKVWIMKKGILCP